MVISCEGDCDAPSSCWKCLNTPIQLWWQLKSYGHTILAGVTFVPLPLHQSRGFPLRSYFPLWRRHIEWLPRSFGVSFYLDKRIPSEWGLVKINLIWGYRSRIRGFGIPQIELMSLRSMNSKSKFRYSLSTSRFRRSSRNRFFLRIEKTWVLKNRFPLGVLYPFSFNQTAIFLYPIPPSWRSLMVSWRNCWYSE